jgi:hypothetical protein
MYTKPTLLPSKRLFFSFAARISVLSRTILISLMIDEDEDDISNIAMVLHFGVRLTCQGHIPRIMAFNQVRELCTPVVSVDIFHFPEICEQAPSLWMNLGFLQPPHWVHSTPTLGRGRKSRSAGIRTQTSQFLVSDANH